MLGTAYTSSYLSDYAVQLSELTAPLRLSQERPRNFPSSYKEAVDRLVESSLQSVAEIYPAEAGAFGYTQEDQIGVGVVLTSDGWVAMHSEINRSAQLSESRVRVRGAFYLVEQSAYDPVSQVHFLKIDANGLPVAALAKGYETQIGEQFFVVSGPTTFGTASLMKQRWPSGEIISSDEPNRRLELDRSVDPGSVVFDLNGEIVAFATEEHAALPIEAIAPAFRSLLETQTISRASLGVNYIDLTHSVDIPSELSRSYRSGALLYGTSAVSRSSTAYKAGVRTGDILLSVNGETINGTFGLDELIAQYRAGDRVQIAFDRKGETQTLEVELGEKE